jgi:hypothetical protein
MTMNTDNLDTIQNLEMKDTKPVVITLRWKDSNTGKEVAVVKITTDEVAKKLEIEKKDFDSLTRHQQDVLAAFVTSKNYSRDAFKTISVVPINNNKVVIESHGMRILWIYKNGWCIGTCEGLSDKFLESSDVFDWVFDHTRYKLSS